MSDDDRVERAARMLRRIDMEGIGLTIIEDGWDTTPAALRNEYTRRACRILNAADERETANCG